MPDLVIARAVRGSLQTIQRALARERRALIPSLRFELSQRRRPQRIVPQLVVIDRILVAQRQAQHPLPYQRFHRVLDQIRIAPVIETTREALDQPKATIQPREQQHTRIGTDRTTVERRDDAASLDRFKFELLRVTLCLHRGLAKSRLSISARDTFTTLAPVFRSGCEKSGLARAANLLTGSVGAVHVVGAR